MPVSGCAGGDAGGRHECSKVRSITNLCELMCSKGMTCGVGVWGGSCSMCLQQQQKGRSGTGHVSKGALRVCTECRMVRTSAKAAGFSTEGL
jgi:hypothetical protein